MIGNDMLFLQQQRIAEVVNKKTHLVKYAQQKLKLSHKEAKL